MKVLHPDRGFNGKCYGLEFQNGAASTTNSAMAKRLEKMGFAAQPAGSEVRQPDIKPQLKT